MALGNDALCYVQHMLVHRHTFEQYGQINMQQQQQTTNLTMFGSWASRRNMRRLMV